MNFVGAAGGWGGAMVQDNIYQTSKYMSSDGCYEMTFVDPQARDFWSATVYNGDGYLFHEVANISSKMAPVKVLMEPIQLDMGATVNPITSQSEKEIQRVNLRLS